MTKQQILDELRRLEAAALAKAQDADAVVEIAGQTDDFGRLKAESDRLYFQWRHLEAAIEAIEQVEEEEEEP